MFSFNWSSVKLHQFAEQNSQHHPVKKVSAKYKIKGIATNVVNCDSSYFILYSIFTWQYKPWIMPPPEVWKFHYFPISGRHDIRHDQHLAVITQWFNPLGSPSTTRGQQDLLIKICIVNGKWKKYRFPHFLKITSDNTEYFTAPLQSVTYAGNLEELKFLMVYSYEVKFWIEVHY